jgi:UDP-MurNAc hydroxylase
MKTSIQFINHASVIVSDGETSVLSDPWYTGDIFHKGWNLLHETSYQDIDNMLNSITHIWISHEHPDHFSIPFFKSYAQKIKDLSITILFQKTKDKRVLKFLTAQGIDVQELYFNRAHAITSDYKVTCIKDGFYDSGLLIESHGEKILNLNDCEIKTSARINDVYSVTGDVDILLTQFSFAAWKGGKKNKRWRDEAAAEKINTMKLQIEKFKPNKVIPFASFVYFSNYENFYLNDAVNKPKDLREKLKKFASKLIIMAPFDEVGGIKQRINIENAVAFWDKKYQILKPVTRFETVDIAEIRKSFELYCKRIHNNNNINLIKIIRAISPISAFKPCIVHLEDLDISIKFDYAKKSFIETTEQAMLSMKSESLNFIFKNSFGFDTLTVNGCFEEVSKNGFARAAKTLAIENLNNLGINIEVKTLFNFSIIKLFLARLYMVTRKLKSLDKI